MRTDCKNYESRTYASGETVRKCNLDLAPEAPWRCPADCSGFAPRMADVDWSHGSLAVTPTPPEPPNLGRGAAEVLDAAEEIVNAAGPAIMAELASARRRTPERSGRAGSWWRRITRRPR